MKPSYAELQFFIERFVMTKCDNFKCSDCILHESGLCEDARRLAARIIEADDQED